MSIALQIKIIALAIFFAFGGIALAHAQDDTDAERPARPVPVEERLEARQENRKARAEERAEKIEKRQENLAEKQETRSTELLERRKQIIQAYFDRVLKRLEAAFDRVERLAERLASRLTKLGEMGVDTSEAQTKLDAANAKITAGRAILEDVRGDIASLLDSENPREIFANVKEHIREAIQAVRDTHKALVEALRAAKAAHDLKTENEEANNDEKETDNEEDE